MDTNQNPWMFCVCPFEGNWPPIFSATRASRISVTSGSPDLGWARARTLDITPATVINNAVFWRTENPWYSSVLPFTSNFSYSPLLCFSFFFRSVLSWSLLIYLVGLRGFQITIQCWGVRELNTPVLIFLLLSYLQITRHVEIGTQS